jgi:hypothetical protein
MTRTFLLAKQHQLENLEVTSVLFKMGASGRRGENSKRRNLAI